MTIHVLLARQRSGTGALGSLLARHPQVRYLGEVFHADHENSAGVNVFYEARHNYFRFLYERLSSEPARVFPEANQKNYADFLAYLEAMHEPGTHLFIDVKYSSTHHFNGGWHTPLEMPKFVRFAKRDLLRMVHLKRRNLVRSYVSGRLAELNNVWHVSSSAEMSVSCVRVDKHALLAFLHATSRGIAAFDGYLKAYPHVVEIYYEDLFPGDGAVAGNELGKISRLLGLDADAFAGMQPGFVKQTVGSLSDLIENYDEVVEHLAATPFASMLCDA